jgi:hypothetical protein
LRRLFFSHPTNIIPIAFFWAVPFALLDGLIGSRIKDGTSSWAYFFGILGLFDRLFFLFVLIGGAIFLLGRGWKSALCYFAASCILYVSIIGSLALKGDRFAFTAGPHREIADIYNRRRSELDLTNRNPRLLDLDSQCHPPGGCACWAVIDPVHSSGIENEIGGWHRPTAAIFPLDTLPINFAIVDVERIDSVAYSVLGCSQDWRGWLPLL